MKINDVILEQQIEESFWDKFKSYTKSFGQQINSGMTADQIERRAEQDQNVKLLVNAFLVQWDNMRYSLQQAYGKEKVTPSMYKEILEKLAYNQIGASIASTNVVSAIQTLLRNGDNLDNNISQDAAYTIITSGIASNISPSLGVKVDVLNRKLSDVGYGGGIPNGVSKIEGLILPVIVMAYRYESGNGQRLIKANNQWHGMGILKKQSGEQDFIDDRTFILNNKTMIKNQQHGNLDIMAMQKLALHDPMQARKTAVILTDPTTMEFSELGSEEIEAWRQQTRS